MCKYTGITEVGEGRSREHLVYRTGANGRVLEVWALLVFILP